ncbi:MOSC domain-containing protein [Marinomonas sp.]
MSPFLSQLNIYPIKSIQGISLPSAKVALSGLVNDRHYMLIDTEGVAVTARDYPQLSLVQAEQLAEQHWQLSHPSMSENLLINGQTFSNLTLECKIWDHQVIGHHCSTEIDQWFNSILHIEVKLVYFGSSSHRFTNRKPDTPVEFADGYPFLLTTNASLAEVNRFAAEEINMAQFRPNIVVDSNEAFAEDTWKRIKIGEVIFENVKPCERCIFTTLNPQTAERSRKGEPLKTLAKFRLSANKTIDFGINLVAENSGIINVGDSIEVLEYQAAPSYLDRRKK